MVALLTTVFPMGDAARLRFIFSILFVASFAATLAAQPLMEEEKTSACLSVKKVQIIVHNKVVSKINLNLFGQFMERAFAEPGPEGALIAGTNQLRPEIADKIKSMDIPVIRFPGGTDVDFLDWRNLIDRVPGRNGGRPVSKNIKAQELTNLFGVDEYFTQVRDRTGCKTILVLNFLDAVAQYKPMKQAALDSCGLLAYANAAQGQKLPDGMPNWPSVRAANGYPTPFGADYIQIGNETWTGNFSDPAQNGWPVKSREELTAFYHECLREYIRVIREIDPKVGIIIDLRMPFGAARRVYEDPYILKNVTLMAYHVYQMGSLTEVTGMDERIYPASAFSETDLWNYWTMIPTWAGEGLADHIPREEPGLKQGLKIACTEWNWNRWSYEKMSPPPSFFWELPAAIGTARHLHGMIRAGDRLALGTQSMLVGSKWNFAAVRFDDQSRFSPHFSPQGEVTNFYRHTVGKEQLKLDLLNGLQTLRVQLPAHSGSFPAGAAVDPLASRNSDQLLIHIVNRYQENPVDFEVEFKGFTGLPREVLLHQLSGEMFKRENQHKEFLDHQISKVHLSGRIGRFHFKKPGIYMIEVPLIDK